MISVVSDCTRELKLRSSKYAFSDNDIHLMCTVVILITITYYSCVLCVCVCVTMLCDITVAYNPSKLNCEYTLPLSSDTYSRSIHLCPLTFANISSKLSNFEETRAEVVEKFVQV